MNKLQYIFTLLITIHSLIWPAGNWLIFFFFFFCINPVRNFSWPLLELIKTFIIQCETLIYSAGIFLCFHTVFAASKEVFQTPHDLLRKHGESSEIQCAHKISGYDRILWYKQTQDREYLFMGYNFLSQSQLEPEFNNQMTLTGNGDSKGILTIKSLTPNDSAEYFCAAYPQCLTFPHPLTKTLSYKLLVLTTLSLSASAHLHSFILSSVRQNMTVISMHIYMC